MRGIKTLALRMDYDWGPGVMHGGGPTALDILTRLLRARGLACPNGRPLYTYRFSRDEYEMVGAFLRSQPRHWLYSREAAALVVMHTAEWFRRDRSGGHWDWKRPLRMVGLLYGDPEPTEHDLLRHR